jgi:hypothetical protein
LVEGFGIAAGRAAIGIGDIAPDRAGLFGHHEAAAQVEQADGEIGILGRRQIGVANLARHAGGNRERNRGHETPLAEQILGHVLAGL